MTTGPEAALSDLVAPPVTHLSIAYMTVAMDDPNPIHHEIEVAKQAGLPNVVAHGTFPIGLAGIALTRVVGHEGLHRLKVDLIAPVFPGDELTVRVEVIDAAASPQEVAIAVANQDGTEVARGHASVELPPAALGAGT